MFIKILVRLFGGTWILKEKCRCQAPGLWRRALAFLYTTSLQAKGSWVSIDAVMEGIPCFPHGVHGIFISGGVTLGKNCVIFQQVTIGSNTLVDSKGIGAPTIGDNCYIGAGAKIIGGVKIGNNVRIGANAMVYKGVPDNSIVVTGEQTVIRKSEPLNNRFYHQYANQWRCFNDEKWDLESDQEVLALLNRKFK